MSTNEQAPISDERHQLLTLVTDLAQQLVPGGTAASITMVLDGAPSTIASSRDVAVQLDQVQYAAKRGPCVEAAFSGTRANAVLADEAGRWPELFRAAQEVAVATTLSLPLLNVSALAGLNIYSALQRPVSPSDALTAGLLAQLAGGIVVATMALDRANRFNRELEQALASRDIIGQAKGVLMERQRLTADDAFDVMRRASQRANRKLRDVAADLVASAERRGRSEP